MKTNKKIVAQYVEKFNRGDLEGLRALFEDNALIYGVLGWGNLIDVVPIWEQLMKALATQLKIEDVIAEGDKVAERFTEIGTSKAPFFNQPATGRSYELSAMEWFIISDGKIQKCWGARDATSQARQLGWYIATSREDVVLP
ncbi:MAG TPA: ester cyclase [Eudoraea sp.]|nr:ester cyclase [Eudoraea sp.]